MASKDYPPLADRPMKNTICLFDVDETLTIPRRHATPEMLDLLRRLRQRCAIGFVGGSDLAKQQEQLSTPDVPVSTLFDFCFAENGLTAFKDGESLPSNSFIDFLGEDRYKTFVNFVLRYLADVDCPVKRGTFVEFRRGMVNISPVGRSASVEERIAFAAYDDEHHIRDTLVRVLEDKFGSWGLTFAIGGQISFDVFPTGWDKTYCLRHLEAEAAKPGGIAYTTIHFFGDKTSEGGNDYQIYNDKRVTGHAVRNPEDTYAQVKALFDL